MQPLSRSIEEGAGQSLLPSLVYHNGASIARWSMMEGIGLILRGSSGRWSTATSSSAIMGISISHNSASHRTSELLDPFTTPNPFFPPQIPDPKLKSNSTSKHKPSKEKSHQRKRKTKKAPSAYSQASGPAESVTAWLAEQEDKPAASNPPNRKGRTPTQAPQSPSTMRHFLSTAESDALDIHNKARAARGLPALQWEARLAKDSEEWARVLTLKREMEHSGCDDGENIFQASGAATYSDATKAWLSEEPNYHGQKIPEGDFMSYGHYTQCMWRETTHVGIGMARTLDGMTFIVARYYPSGNMMGKTPY